MLTLGSGVVKVAFWKSGAVIGQTSNYFNSTVGYGNTGQLVTVGEVGGDVEECHAIAQIDQLVVRLAQDLASKPV